MVPLTIDFANLHTILGTLYEDMLPLCKDMMDVGKGLAGLGALFYVAVRIWQSMARAEPIDVYPLLRPFAIGICILLFPTLVLGTLNTVLSPIVQGTHKMLEGQTLDMERYRAQKEELEKTVEARDKLYSLIAHDLRAPIGSLRMVMNALSMNVDRSKFDDDIYEVFITGNRLAEDTFVLLDNLLKWTKSQTGRLKTVFQDDVEILSLIKGELEVSEVLAELKQISIVFNGYSEAKARIDQDMIKTVLRNLLNNAIKFSNRGSEIIVSLKEEGDRVIISVSDKGKGIKTSDQNKIFKTNVHISSFGTENEEGSGLGLLICKEFINRNNGEIWFESREGAGSTFSFYIPIQK